MLALDPGSTNFGISVVDMELKTGKVRPVRTSLLDHPIKSLAHDLPTSVSLFINEMDSWMALGPDGWIAERFQSRGLRGSTVEAVTLMCGLMIQTYQKPYKLITAATWKNAVNRKMAQGWSTFENLKEAYSWAAVQPHQLDAALIGLYGLELGTRVSPKYDLQKFIIRLERRSDKPLVKRKVRNLKEER